MSISPSTLDRLPILHTIGYPHYNAYLSDAFYTLAILDISIHRADNFLSNDAMPPLRNFDDVDGRERGQKKTDDLKAMTTLGPRTLSNFIFCMEYC